MQQLIPESVDPIYVALGAMVLWWIFAAIGSVLRSSRSAGRKLGWVVALLLLPPLGLLAFVVAGRDRSRRRGLGVTGYMSIATLGAVALLAATRPLWQGYEHPAWVGAWSLVTFVIYAIDKSAAAAGSDERGRSKQARVNELALHLLAIVGGFVGGWIGRHALRHKTRKPLFAVVLLLATGLHASKMLALW